MRLQDKIIIITGASSGIGAAAARLFAQEGACLVLGARRSNRLEALADELGRERIAILAGDVTDPDFAQTLVDLATTRFGGLDGAFNNAGITGDMGPLAEMSPESWDAVQDTNLRAAFLATRAQAPALIARGGGALLFTGSFVGVTIGLPGMGAYAAAKAGLLGLTQVLAVELGSHGIRVNALLPGGTRTEMAGADPAVHKTVAAMHALGRMADPEEIARTALFLLSDDASFITGSPIFADGGNSILKAVPE